MKIRRKHLYLTVVAICAGFLVSFSYQFTQDQEGTGVRSTLEWIQEDQLREKHNEVRKENSLYEQYLRELQQQISVKEAQMSEAQTDVSATQHELEMLRLISGLSEGTGPGITVSLEDSTFAADSHNPNDYIVHEQDVRRVVNELFASGAEGISVNGQRVTHLTSIRCVGPTVIVNGVKSAAPFQITAIGDPETLSQGLLLPGGVVDGLRDWNINVKIEKHDQLLVPAYIGEF